MIGGGGTADPGRDPPKDLACAVLSLNHDGPMSMTLNVMGLAGAIFHVPY